MVFFFEARRLCRSRLCVWRPFSLLTSRFSSLDPKGPRWGEGFEEPSRGEVVLDVLALRRRAPAGYHRNDFLTILAPLVPPSLPLSAFSFSSLPLFNQRRNSTKLRSIVVPF